MKLAIALVCGITIGSVVTYGLMPFPRVLWDGVNGSITSGIFNCVGVEARNGAVVTVSGSTIVAHRFCQGFLRTDGDSVLLAGADR